MGAPTNIVYIGRLEENTGLGKFLQWLKENGKKSKVDFCGDGPLHKECNKYGTVHGFCNPTPFLNKADLCVPGGYLAYIEAKSRKCPIKVFWGNNLKKEYWEEIKKIKKFPTWDEVAGIYENLYLHHRP